MAHAKIWINEFSANGPVDWIEIYNDGQESVNLEKYRIRDSTFTNKLDLSGEIAATGYKVFEWENKLNNSGDTIKLIPIGEETTVVDEIVYGESTGFRTPATGETGGRQSDGGSTWAIFATSTKGSTNVGAELAAIPTAVPQSTPTPQREPTPTRVPTPTRTPTPIKPSPTPKISITPKVSVTPKVIRVTPKLSPAVLGSKTSISGAPTPLFDVDMGEELVTPAPLDPLQGEVVVKNAQTSPLVMTIVGGLFMITCGILMVFRKRIWKK